MILMAIDINSKEFIEVAASLALLSPLVRELGKWHINARKTSKPNKALEPDKTTTNCQSQSSTAIKMSKWDRMTRLERFLNIFSLCSVIMNLVFLIISIAAFPAHPATSHDVEFVGLIIIATIVAIRPIKF